jgi:glutathione S-transferase
MAERLTLLSMPSSGNSYKVRLLLALLGCDYVHVALEYQTPELAEAKAAGRLPTGKLPVLELHDGRVQSESNAILWFLGEGTTFLPEGTFARARILSWMFFEQNQHETTIAVRAALRTYPHRAPDATPARLAALLQAGNAVFDIMETRLAGRDWFEGEGPTIADIALYAYSHTAESRGGYDLSGFPSIRAWIARIAALPGHVGLDDLPA